MLAGAAVASLPASVTAAPAGTKAFGQSLHYSFPETTGTGLYDLDINRRSLFLQAPPNAGTITLQGYFAHEKFGQIGFDIASGRSDGVANSNVGYVSFTSGGTVQLWTVDLLTGNGHEIGDFPAASSVTDFSIAIR